MPTVAHLIAAVRSTAVMPAPIAALFWLWLLGSVVILGVRLMRRITRSDDDTELPPLPAVVPPAAPIGDPAAAPSPAPPTLAPPTAPGGGATPAAPPPPGAPGAPGVPVAPVVPAAGRQGFFASGPSDDEPAPPPVDAPRPTVAEALSGVRMPCGLSPVVDGSVSIPNPFRVAFLTTEADAAGVGSSIGDELERLGYRLSTVAATELVARKPGVEVRVVLYPTPAAARRGLDAIFPLAPDHAVGLEIST